MKSIIAAIILIISHQALAQQKDCSLWLGAPYDSISLIKDTAEKYLQADLVLSGSPEVKTMYELKDSEELNVIKIWMKGKRTVVGSTITTIYSISSIRITSLAERIERLLQAFKANLSDCNASSTSSTLMVGNTKLIVEKQGGDWSKKNIALSTMTITSVN